MSRPTTAIRRDDVQRSSTASLLQCSDGARRNEERDGDGEQARLRITVAIAEMFNFAGEFSGQFFEAIIEAANVALALRLFLDGPIKLHLLVVLGIKRLVDGAFQLLNDRRDVGDFALGAFVEKLLQILRFFPHAGFESLSERRFD